MIDLAFGYVRVLGQARLEQRQHVLDELQVLVVAKLRRENKKSLIFFRFGCSVDNQLSLSLSPTKNVS